MDVQTATHPKTALGLALSGLTFFIAGFVIYLTTSPVNSGSSILFVLATLVMFGAIIVLSFSPYN